MVIHDFAHTKMPYFSIGKSKRFGWIIFLLSCTGIEYKLPGRHGILGDLLDINYKRYSYKKSQYLIKAADTFGIYFIGDGDSIEKNSIYQYYLIHIKFSSSCTQYCGLFQPDGSWRKIFHIHFKQLLPYLLKHYPSKILTDALLFDGASNVQEYSKVF